MEERKISSNVWIFVVAAIGIIVIAVMIISQSTGGGGGAGDTSSIVTTPTADVELNVPFDAATSPDLQTVSETREALRQRGFEDVELLVFFDIEGEFLDSMAIDSDSDEIFPTYGTLFYSETTSIIFAFIINNGRIVVKTPFVDESDPDKFVVLSETSFMTEYNPEANTFRYHIPTDEVILVEVPIISRQLLETLLEEDIGL